MTENITATDNNKRMFKEVIAVGIVPPLDTNLKLFTDLRKTLAQLLCQ